MGMFDWVNFKGVPCPQCGAAMHGFQSKDAHCELDTVEPDGLSTFYAGCRRCRTWVQYSRDCHPPHPLRPEPLSEAEVLAMGFVKSVTPPAPPANARAPAVGTPSALPDAPSLPTTGKHK